MQIIKRPFITEKTIAQASLGCYTFIVDQKSNKAQIAEAISSHYNVNIINVSTAIMHGKVRRAGKKMRTLVKPNWKKAIVRLRVGQKIDAFDVSQAQEKK